MANAESMLKLLIRKKAVRVYVQQKSGYRYAILVEDLKEWFDL